MIGISRKSFLQFDNDSPSDRLYPSLSMQAIGVYNGVDIIRTHDVLETIKSIKVVDKINDINGFLIGTSSLNVSEFYQIYSIMNER